MYLTIGFYVILIKDKIYLHKYLYSYRKMRHINCEANKISRKEETNFMVLL